MNKNKVFGALLVLVLTLTFSMQQPSFAQVAMTDYAGTPPFVTSGAPPLVMFMMARDHRLFFKAYNDVIDLDNDGVIDTTYKDTINYYGYFDSKKCYTYNSSGSNDQFDPVAASTGTNLHFCDGTKWSGNFLNWATMARIDVIRKVLYGGTRFTDTSNTTILSRTLLPRDAHSWVKAYNGANINSLTPHNWTGITICNLNTSKTETSSLIYVINGYYPYAASTEGQQCVNQGPGLGALSVSNTYKADVKVCVSGLLETNCETYGSSTPSYKPVGLLQAYGLDRKGNTDPSDDVVTMKFGLLTGAYATNVSGGVLRSNIVDLNSEVDNANGQTKGSSEIIKNIDRFRVIQYSYSTGWYDEGGTEGSCVPTEPAVLADGTCKSWGNPIAEMLYETIRYFRYGNGSGASATSEFRPSNPDSGISSLTVESQWDDPYANCPHCSKPFALVLSDANPSYDSDHLPGSYWPATITPNNGTPSVQDLMSATYGTAQVGADIDALEGIGSVFVGESAGTTDRACTQKTGSFKSIRGICVEEPTKRGSYYLAGLAHYAKTNDLRTDKAGSQNMTTYSVVTSAPIPDLDFTVGTNAVQIIPIFHDGCPKANHGNPNQSGGTGYTGCTSQGTGGDNSKGAIVDFQFCQPDGVGGDWTTEQANGYTSCYDIMWDDAEYGWDYDLDIRYRIYVKKTSTTITVKTKGLYAAAGHLDYAGYFIQGVSGAGEYLDVACGGTAEFSDCDRYDDVTSGNDTGPADNPKNAMVERTFTATGSTSGFLKNPLWYAAKYGGFDDNNNNKKPDLTAEWDTNSDGDPDTYFYAANPLVLEAKLTAAFAAILNRSASGTAASVLASSTTGEGAIFQSFFFPTQTDPIDGREVKWTGYTQSLFTDAYGNLREDTNQDGKLTLTTDKIVIVRYDSSISRTIVDKYDDTNGDGKADAGAPTTIELHQLKGIWEAGKRLALTNSSTRNIWTWVDLNNNDRIDSGEYISFTDGADSSTNNQNKLGPYLRTVGPSPLGAPYTTANLIQFIRGCEPTGTGAGTCATYTGYSSLRDRRLNFNDFSGTPTKKVWKLGDIIHSTPVIVGAPRERFDVLYGDASYRDFFNAYKNRRQVLYVGGNDGMLHAFNAGFYQKSNGTHHGCYTAALGDNCATQTSVTLGQERWGYIPQSLLPHLAWLAMPSYSHVYYVDLKPKITDARIFCGDPNSPTQCITGQSGVSHPGGWGTILIGGFRLGGSCNNCPTGNNGARPMTFTADFDNNGGTANTSRNFYSAYFVVDITDPESDPKVLWEFSDSSLGLGLTTSYPTVVRVNDKNTGTTKTNKDAPWFVVFGSGAVTTNFTTVTTQQGKGFVVNLATGPTAAASSKNNLVKSFGDTEADPAISGDVISVDKDLDFRVDVIYWGQGVYNNLVTPNWRGQLIRLSTGCHGTTCNIDPSNWGVGSPKSPTKLVDVMRDFNDSNAANNKKLGVILVAPGAALDDLSNLWVFGGSGRYHNTTDKTDTGTQYLVGVKDPVMSNLCTESSTFNCTVGPSNLTYGSNTTASGVDWDKQVDLSTVQVCVVGTGSGAGLCDASTQVTGISAGLSGTGGTTGTYQSLIALVKSKGGWFVKLATPSGTPTPPSERMLGTPIVFAGIVFFPTFIPSTDICIPAGTGYVYALFYQTGGPYTESVVGVTAGTSGAADTVNKSISLGEGMSTAVAIHLGATGEGTTGGGSLSGMKGCSQSSTGALNCFNINPAYSTTSRYVTWVNQRD